MAAAAALPAALVVPREYRTDHRSRSLCLRWGDATAGPA